MGPNGGSSCSADWNLVQAAQTCRRKETFHLREIVGNPAVAVGASKTAGALGRACPIGQRCATDWPSVQGIIRSSEIASLESAVGRPGATKCSCYSTRRVSGEVVWTKKLG
jgi:hypothetical protein